MSNIVKNASNGNAVGDSGIGNIIEPTPGNGIWRIQNEITITKNEHKRSGENVIVHIVLSEDEIQGMRFCVI